LHWENQSIPHLLGSNPYLDSASDTNASLEAEWMYRAACSDSIQWCRVENISPLLQIGVQLLLMSAGDCVVVPKTATQGILASYFLGAAYFT